MHIIWHEVSTKPPDLDEERTMFVLVTDGDTIFEGAYYHAEGAWYSPVEFSPGNNILPIVPTHWAIKPDLLYR